MKKVNSILIFIGLLFTPVLRAQSVDSLTALLQTNIPDTTKINILQKCCNYGVSEADGALAIKYCTELINFSTTLKDTFSIINGHSGLSKIYMMAPLNVAKVKHHANEMIAWSEQINDPKNVAQGYMFTGISYLFQIDSCVKAKSPVGEYADKAKEEFEKAIKIYDEIEGVRMSANAYGKIGDIYNLQGLTDQSTAYYTVYYEKCLEINYEYGIMNALIQIGSAHYTEGSRESLNKAIPYLNEALQYANKLNYNYQQLYCNKTLSAIYEELGDFEHAFIYQKKWMVLNDSISGLEKAKQIQALEAQYETEKKELTIANQTKELGQNKRIQLFGLLVIGLLGVIAMLSIWTAQNRKKTNQKLAIRNNEIESQKIQIEEKNKQNEMLVREIHHRVKNNLQVISSLLNLQSMHIDDETVLDVVKEGQGRVKSMALLHQNLYQGDNLTAIEMQEYVGLLLKSIGTAFGLRQNHNDRIQLKNKLAKQELDIDLAIPLGLIVNELVTNALKYAFPNEDSGIIEVSLEQANEEGQLRLGVRDNGVGISNAIASENSTSFGVKLMKILTKKLKGEMEVIEKNGTLTYIYFSKK